MATILIVDDSATDRELAGGLLSAKGNHRILAAASGTEALHRLAETAVDLVVTDLHMPEMTGLELVGILRRQFAMIPVILITGGGSELLAVRALHAGAASYVPKVALADSLAETVRRVLAAARDDQAHLRVRRFLTGQQLEYEIESDPELISPLVQSLQDAAEAMGIVEENDRIRLGVALQEALVNACYHGNLEVSSRLREEDHRAYYDLARQRSAQSPYQERRIVVRATMQPGTATFVIIDEGPGFDLSQLPDPTDPANLDRPCGRGLLLMQTFMDQVDYNSRGNQVTLTKRRKPHRVPGRGVPR